MVHEEGSFEDVGKCADTGTFLYIIHSGGSGGKWWKRERAYTRRAPLKMTANVRNIASFLKFTQGGGSGRGGLGYAGGDGVDSQCFNKCDSSLSFGTIECFDDMKLNAIASTHSSQIESLHAKFAWNDCMRV